MTPAGRGDPVALVATPAHGFVAVTPAGAHPVDIAEVRRIESTTGPRWVWWSAPAVDAVLSDVAIARAFDLAAVHRLLHGGWRAEPALVWALAHGLDPEALPTAQPPDLFEQGPTPAELAEPIGPDGHLRPEWPAGEWCASADHAATWGELALRVATAQQAELATLRADHPQVLATARSESAAEVLCVELGRDGLPVDRAAAEAIIGAIVGPRPRSAAEAVAQREARDADVLRLAPPGTVADLRNPAQVRSLLRRVGVEVPDTRAWRLEQIRDEHPVVEALLAWRRIERTATTYGYGWLDAHVGADGRLRGQWSGSDGAAGRMTATAGIAQHAGRPAPRRRRRARPRPRAR